MSTRIASARDLERAALRDLFNDGFSGYLVPMHLDEAAFDAHLDRNDIDLGASPVLVGEQPLAFALVGRRGDDAWIGGMGTVPAARRSGHARRVLEAAIEGARERAGARVALEVIDANRAALALYEQLGFEVTRDLLVWALPPCSDPGPGGGRGPGPGGPGELDLERAHAWIAAHRASPEPWQRADRVIARLARGAGELRSAEIQEHGVVVGAVIFALAGETASVLQIAARDETVAMALLRRAAGSRALRLANVPADEAPSRAMRALGGELVARQHEMQLVL